MIVMFGVSDDLSCRGQKLARLVFFDERVDMVCGVCVHFLCVLHFVCVLLLCCIILFISTIAVIGMKRLE